MDYEVLYAFILATAALAIAPGPDNIYVLTQSISHGKKYGLATVGGLISGCLVHTALLAFGVSAIIKESDTLFFMIKLFGAIYLLYLAYSVFRAESSINLLGNTDAKKSLGQLFGQGFVMNVLNPKVTIFFLAFFPAFLFSEKLNMVWQFFILGGLFMLVSFVVFGSIALLAGYISDYMGRNSKVERILKWFRILVFIGIAVYILLSDK